jgi:hypothetical protein
MGLAVEKLSYEEVYSKRDEAMTGLETGESEIALEYLGQMKAVIENHFSLVTARVGRGEPAPVEEAWLLGGITFPFLTYFIVDCEKVMERGFQPPEIDQELIDFVAYHFPGFTRKTESWDARGGFLRRRYKKVLTP